MKEPRDPPRLKELREPELRALQDALDGAQAHGPSVAQLDRMRHALGLPRATPSPGTPSPGTREQPPADARREAHARWAPSETTRAIQRRPSPPRLRSWQRLALASGGMALGLAWLLGYLLWPSTEAARPPDGPPRNGPQRSGAVSAGRPAEAAPAHPAAPATEPVPENRAGRRDAPTAQPEPPRHPRDELEPAGSGAARRRGASAAKRSTQARPTEQATPKRATGDPAAELALLERARRHARSAPDQALALVAEHATRYPDGVLAQEREVIAIDALLAAGRRTDAQRRAQRFYREYPRSAHTRRIRQMLSKAR